MGGESSGVSEMKHWNLEVIADVLTKNVKGFSWLDVAQCFDQPDAAIVDAQMLRTLVILFARGAGMPFPIGPCLLARRGAGGGPAVVFGNSGGSRRRADLLQSRKILPWDTVGHVFHGPNIRNLEE